MFVVFVFTNSFKSNQDLHQRCFCGITTRHVLLFPIGDPGCKKLGWDIGSGVRSLMMLPHLENLSYLVVNNNLEREENEMMQDRESFIGELPQSRVCVAIKSCKLSYDLENVLLAR